MDDKGVRNRREDHKMNISPKRLALMFFAAVLVHATVFGQAVSPSNDLPNLYKVNAKLYRGGQPTEAGMKQLMAMGVKTVIDLRSDNGRAKQEQKWALDGGLAFVNIPLSNLFRPKKEQIDAAIRQMDIVGYQPVFIHCQRGSHRTGMVKAVYISHDGWSGNQANAEAKKFDFGWWQFWMKDYINDYYRDYRKAHPGK